MDIVARILLVDDDQDILELLEYNLSREGYTVMSTANSAAAFDLVETFQPDLIILDVMMPGINGFEVCTKIRTQSIGPDPIVFFMTQGEDKLQKTAFQSGGDDFIQKFAGLRTLISRVNLVLKRKFKIRKRQSTLRLGTLLIDRDNGAVVSHNKMVKLKEPEFELLFFLVQNAKRSIPIRHLNAAMTGSDMFSRHPPIMQSLEMLMKKIGDGFITFTSPHRVRFNAD
jgi:two-component system, OmpR family, alkaline phosphatase synthesis response regulator PhoP